MLREMMKIFGIYHLGEYMENIWYSPKTLSLSFFSKEPSLLKALTEYSLKVISFRYGVKIRR